MVLHALHGILLFYLAAIDNLGEFYWKKNNFFNAIVILFCHFLTKNQVFFALEVPSDVCTCPVTEFCVQKYPGVTELFLFWQRSFQPNIFNFISCLHLIFIGQMTEDLCGFHYAHLFGLHSTFYCSNQDKFLLSLSSQHYFCGI